MDNETDIVCSEAVTNGHIAVRVRMRQSGEVIIDSKAPQNWQIEQAYLKGKLRLVLSEARRANGS